MATAPKKTHFKNLFDNAYLGAYSLDTGDGHYESVDLTIASVTVEEVHGENGRTDHKPVLHFKESGPQAKAMILNATNAKRLWKALGTPYKEDWVGRKITVGVERVNSFGEKVDALRIRDKAPKQDVEQQTYVCCSTSCFGALSRMRSASTFSPNELTRSTPTVILRPTQSSLYGVPSAFHSRFALVAFRIMAFACGPDSLKCSTGLWSVRPFSPWTSSTVTLAMVRSTDS